ncbi:mediator of RNA polymerase II transcription subunit 29-like [Planococcus citri]|uniref:mediator of RNA polymerase II transcription subunit 29-like n=1 Tax=Planococcus citri TaxID=170843 RepID=UPI0031F8A41B
MQANPVQQQQQERVDNIAKVKMLTSQLRDILSSTLRTAAQTIHANNLIDSGSLKANDAQIPRLDKSIEEFFAVCDQIEDNLKTAMECYQQSASSQRYLPLPVAPNRFEPHPQENNALAYPQYLTAVRSQISYLKEVHDLLLNASQNIGPNE